MCVCLCVCPCTFVFEKEKRREMERDRNRKINWEIDKRKERNIKKGKMQLSHQTSKQIFFAFYYKLNRVRFHTSMFQGWFLIDHILTTTKKL